MDEYTDISGNPQPHQAKSKAGTWAGMNYIQRMGCLGLFPFMILSFVYDGRLGIIFGLIGWTSIFFGYVAGNLWRYRHALHFWWSVAFAAVVHVALLPIYADLVDLIKNAPHHEGKGYMYLAFGLLITEVLTLLYALKHFGMWLHKRIHKPSELERAT